jgi:phosphoribosylformylglycinamidine synthase
MCIGGRIGATIETLPHSDPATALFSESTGRLVVELDPRNLPAFMKVMGDQGLQIGRVDDSGLLALRDLEPIPIASLVDAFNAEAGRGSEP